MVPTFSKLLETLQPSYATIQRQGKVVNGPVTWYEDVGEYYYLNLFNFDIVNLAHLNLCDHLT